MLHHQKLNPITSLAQLHSEILNAVALEFSTIPLYLTAMYSIKENTNDNAANVLQEIVVQEMLHMATAANLLVATGGKPSLNSTAFVPDFPTKLRDHEDWFTVGLTKFSPEALQTFLFIEEPAYMAPDNLITIGDFYQNIQTGLDTLAADPTVHLFPGDAIAQVPSSAYSGKKGAIYEVQDLDSAQLAINAIITEGEGKPDANWDPHKPFPSLDDDSIYDDDNQLLGQEVELAHYYRFNELKLGRRYRRGDTHAGGPTGAAIQMDFDQVYNMTTNPHLKDFQGDPELLAKDQAFNEVFSILLDQLNEAFNGNPDAIDTAIGTMFKLKPLAVALLQSPLPDSEQNHCAGPTWQYIPERSRGNC